MTVCRTKVFRNSVFLIGKEAKVSCFYPSPRAKLSKAQASEGTMSRKRDSHKRAGGIDRQKRA